MINPIPHGSELRGLRTVVMGLGQFGGGVATARYLAGHGAHVIVTDLRDQAMLAASCAELADLEIEWRLGGHAESDFECAHLVVANPAVRPNHPLLHKARAAGAVVTSEMELFLLETRAKLLLVSGTHGKSSCVHILQQLLQGQEPALFLGGNLGRPLLGTSGAYKPQATCIVEISSYQLDALHTGHALQKARGVGLTALATDHLERHGDLEGYWRAKGRLFQLAEFGALAAMPAAHWKRAPFPALRDANASLNWMRYGDARSHDELDAHYTSDTFAVGEANWTAPTPWPFAGEFQRENVLLALTLARAAGLPQSQAAAALHRLRGLPHRMQRVAESAELIVLDNGVSTTPESTLAGLDACPAPALLLIGGQAKRGLDYAGLARACVRRGDLVFAFGRAATQLAETWADAGGSLEPHPDLPSAFESAWQASLSGQCLLFSPACASFDAYPNFQARAQEFLQLVAKRCTTTNPSRLGD